MKQLLIGIDVGSTTTKITVLDKTTESLLYSDYRRHHADQLASVLFAIRQAAEKFLRPLAFFLRRGMLLHMNPGLGP